MQISRAFNLVELILVIVTVLSSVAYAQEMDLNGDGMVDFTDTDAARNVDELEKLLATIGHPRGDLDGDGKVEVLDLAVFDRRYGNAGDYTDGDLNLDGVVSFEDWAIFLENFGKRHYSPPPPAGIPVVQFTIGVDVETGSLALSGNGSVINGFHIQSESGALLPQASNIIRPDPFSFVLVASRFEGAFGKLTNGITLDGEVLLPIGVHSGTDITEIQFTWSQPGSYDTFNFLHSPSSALPGDFNQDGKLTDVDIDLLSSEVRANSHRAAFDLNKDQIVNQQDRQIWVEELAGTRFGDADLDGVAQFSDFLAVSSNFSQQGGWGEGDFDGSGDIQFPDFLLLSDNFGQVAVETKAIPEPNAFAIVVALLAILWIPLRSAVSYRNLPPTDPCMR